MTHPPLTAEELATLQYDYARAVERLKEAHHELRCPACGCADAIDAQSQECGCDSPLCERTGDDGTLAESWLKQRATIAARDAAIRERDEAIEKLEAEISEWVADDVFRRAAGGST